MMREIMGVAVPSAGELVSGIYKRLGHPRPGAVPEGIRAQVSWALPLARMAAQPLAVAVDADVERVKKGAIHAEGLTIESVPWASLAAKSREPGPVLAFACTLGPQVDRMAALAKKHSLAMGYVMEAVESEILEHVADRLAKNLAREDSRRARQWSARFSPGFCDWPREGRKGLFSVLCPEEIGARATASGGLAPSKTITGAVLGAKTLPAQTPCRYCPVPACRLRKEKHSGKSGGKIRPAPQMGLFD